MNSVVDACGGDEDGEGVFVRWGQAELGAGAEDNGADVECCFCIMWGYVFGVGGYREVHGGEEDGGRDWGDREEGGGVGEAGGVEGWAEDCYFVGGGGGGSMAKGF